MTLNIALCKGWLTVTLQVIMNFIYLFIFFTPVFVVAKILTLDWKFRAKEFVYILLSGMLFSAIQLVPRIVAIVSPTIHTFHSTELLFPITQIGSIIRYILVFIYIYKLKQYTVSKAVILFAFSSLFAYISYLFVSFVFEIYFNMRLVWFPRQFSGRFVYVFTLHLFSAFLATLVVKTLPRLRKAINANPHIQTTLVIGSLISWLTVMVVTTMTAVTLEHMDYLVIGFILLAFVCIFIIVFFLYTRFIINKYAQRQQESELRNLQLYLTEIEQQQTAIRKFKHDQQNLFSTLDMYVQDRDWDGLLGFYPKLRVASDLITKNEFELEGLNNIKVREIKNILIAKLVTAQNLKLEIKLEVGNVIDDVPVDAVAMVRMLGIILDNAIEELQTLGAGTLYVVCFKAEDSTNFMVQNTCRADMPPVRQLIQLGFSTKGTERGLGLSNLHELTDSLPNVILMTDVKDGHFTQTLIVGGAS